jgi:hypothetical protein
MLGYGESKSLTSSQETALLLTFVGPHPALGVSRQDTRRIRRWLVNRHLARWRGLGNTETGSRSHFGTLLRFLSFNNIQSRVFTGLLTGHNTLRMHLYLMGLSDSPLCRRCGAEGETSPHILCECEALPSLRQVYLRPFFFLSTGH